MKCVRPDCEGSYDADGYCDHCGRKAPAGASGPAPASGPASVSAGTRGTAGTAWSGSLGTRGSRASARGQLGAGLIEMPRVPMRDPATVVMVDPKVAESRRFCSACDSPVGRGRDGRPGLDEGFCASCRTPFSFVPRLRDGDVVNGRYELIGCLAYGGLGWIYLARDRNIGDEVTERWVVLKGLINTSDPDAMAAAVTERRFLVEVDHPNIVQIYDFVQHPDPKTGDLVSYIVMEYVGGRSLRDLLLARRPAGGGRPEPMPLPEVLAYGLEVLPPLGHLHGRGLLFCDFKPDNVIHAEEQLKLIDLGAVRRMDDQVSAVYGTPGYQAPEVPEVGPSIASDLYTVGRALAVLSFDFVGFSGKYAQRLPEPAEVPLLAEYESYYRLLKRATHPDPHHRFGSAQEMRDQLHGVLREVLSTVDGVPRPAPSALFTPERRAFGIDAGEVSGVPGGAPPASAAVIPALPLPTVDVHDPGAGYLATIGTTDQEALLAALAAAPVRSPEVVLRTARAHVERGDPGSAEVELAALAGEHPDDWRIDWYRGLAALAANQAGAALVAFDGVYDALPGEPAAQLAMAVATEHTGDLDRAGGYYTRVWQADRGFVSAAFGVARVRFNRGDRAGAVEVLDQVPESSTYHVAAQVAAVRVRLGEAPQTLPEPDLLDASSRLERLELDVERQARLSVEAIHKALQWVLATQRPTNGRVLGHSLTERELRFGLERSYRLLAKLSPDRQARASLVDMANAVRPRTLV